MRHFENGKPFPPSDQKFRKKIDIMGIEIEDVNKTAIKAYVDGDKTTYPGITVASPTGGQPERIVQHLPNGRTVVKRSDGSKYSRLPEPGDAHASRKPPVTVPSKGIKINLGK